MLVRVEGLEPPRLAAPEPKSGASTDFATPAQEVNAHYNFVPERSLAKLKGRCERKITSSSLTKLQLNPISFRMHNSISAFSKLKYSNMNGFLISLNFDHL